jgi:fatty-acyl-CoA synthase
MTAIEQNEAAVSGVSPARAWLRALELTAAIPHDRTRTLPAAVEQMAARMGDAPALLSDYQSFTYRALARRANQYARWALEQGLQKGDVVCLLMGNCPEYFAIWLGITSVGAVVSLLNTNLTGASLAHSIRIVAPRHIIASAEFSATLNDALAHSDAMPHAETLPAVSLHGSPDASFNQHVERFSGEALTVSERTPPVVEDLALYIYTSGTTGMPKAARVTHARAMQWSLWFAGMMDVQPADRMYNCLPMYHSVGGVQSIGAMLVAGGSVVLREKFSASQFWSDVVRWDCTLLQYIGELCRYLLHTEPSSRESSHRIRLACGNGLSAEIWEAFETRFRIPQILEFYAATEGSVSLFNIRGKRGAIGHIPAYLAHRFSPLLIVIDPETGEPVRDDAGLCIRCGPGQAGEALGKLIDDPSSLGSRFDGYNSVEASEKKILRNVVQPGDAWFRTGDLMRRDGQGYYYFVDRVGDTFRRKGENVAASEVAQIVSAFPGILHANVYGVAVPGVDGRVGMAAVQVDGELNLDAFHEHLGKCLPSYARPVFVRVIAQVELTGTFKYSKTELVRQGYDPRASRDAIYFDTAEHFVRMDEPLYRRIQSGEFRL